eukprot:6471171-Amphidinium_carterae.2
MVSSYKWSRRGHQKTGATFLESKARTRRALAWLADQWAGTSTAIAAGAFVFAYTHTNKTDVGIPMSHDLGMTNCFVYNTAKGE